MRDMNKTAIAAAGMLLLAIGRVASAGGNEIGFQKIQISEKFYSEGACFGDFNKDGKNDVVSGPFWYAGPEFKKQHRFGPGEAVDPLKYSEYFFSWASDINKDGWADIVVAGFPGADTSWFQNPRGKDQVWLRHKIVGVTDNESPEFVDMTGEQAPELVCMSGGSSGFLRPEGGNYASPWLFQAISEDMKYQRFTHGLGVGDVNGDGKMDLLEHSGWWEQPANLVPVTTWTRHEADFGPGGAQMYAYDVNGDGLNDVITTIEAHGYGLAWFEQVREAGKVSFKKHMIVGMKDEPSPVGVTFTQMHAVALVDMNGDGLKDIVTGKRYWAHGPTHDPESDKPAVLYWFELKREAGKGSRYVAHQIDDNSGVGTQCTVGDVNGDGKPDVVIGNKKGTFIFLQSAGK